MRPKEYYEQNTIQEDARYVFTLFPSEFEPQYQQYIKKPLEKIKVGDRKVTCYSHIEAEPGVDKLGEIWKRIQKASIIIANITGFKPNVMLELGVALMKKERVILIAHKSLQGKPDIPFEIGTLNVEFYESGKLVELSEKLVAQVEKWITPDEPKIKNPKAIQLMNDILGLRRERKYEPALILFESIEKIERGNWYIYKEWGITYKKSNDYDKAIKKLQKALEFTRSNRHKSKIYTELGAIYRENKMINEALVAFEKAENLDRDNAELFERWAYLYHNMGRHQDAMNKMTMAVKLDENNEVYKWKFEFYGKKFTDKNFTMGLGKFLEGKKRVIKTDTYWASKPPIRSPHQKSKQYDDRNPSSPPPPNDPNSFKRFASRYRPKQTMEGKIIHVDESRGIYVDLEPGICGLLWAGKLPRGFNVNPRFNVGKKISVKLLLFKYDKCQIDLELARQPF